MTEQPTEWKKSSRSGENACVEVSMTPTGVLFRDSKDPDGPRLSFTPEAVAALVADLRDGELRGPAA